jgi:hypothetical protein
MARTASRVWGDEDLWGAPQRSTGSRPASAHRATPGERALSVASATRVARATAREMEAPARSASASARTAAVPSRPASGGARTARTVSAGAPVPGRRTVTIRGQVAPPRRAVARRRPPRTPIERLGARPDRVALWAVVMGFFLILVAATSGHLI